MEVMNGLGSDMRLRKLLFWFIALFVFFVIWKLNTIESDIDDLHFLEVLKKNAALNKEQIELSQQQLMIIKQFYRMKVGVESPIIYAITPTYTRAVQKAELTRISQTLSLAPNVHWIVVEDATEKTDLVRNLLKECTFMHTHLNIHSEPPKDKPKTKFHRGVDQRNAGLKWLRENLELGKDKGVVYFMDDDNTYSVKLFKEIAKVKKVGVWPVGLVGGLNAEKPILDPDTGKVVKWQTGWRPDRKFAIDMAGFAINLDLVLTKPEALFSQKMSLGHLESEFLSFFITKEELEPLADNCTKVYVWHTRTETPKINGIIEGLEV